MDFWTAKLALVAFAIVKPDGSSPDVNSGVLTRRISTGVYEVTLPDHLGMTTPPPHEMDFVSPALNSYEPSGFFRCVALQNPDGSRSSQVRQVSFHDASGDARDVSFNIVIYRPVTSTALNTDS
jgi:hypothetical protein